MKFYICIEYYKYSIFWFLSYLLLIYVKQKLVLAKVLLWNILKFYAAKITKGQGSLPLSVKYLSAPNISNK